MPTTDRTTFDWRQVQLRHEAGGWKLQAGSLELASFGHNDTAARQALSALRHYRFTERQSMSDGATTFSCYLAGPQSPRGVPIGVQAQSFAPDKLEVRQDGAQYLLHDGTQPVVRLGTRQADAQRLLEVIRTNGYDRLCQLPGSQDGGGMTFLVRSR
jgi:hypothetical protein